MDFLGKLSKKIEVDINFGQEHEHEHHHEQTRTVEKTTTVKVVDERIMMELTNSKNDVARLTQEKEGLKSQLMQLQKMIGGLNKSVHDLKQSNTDLMNQLTSKAAAASGSEEDKKRMDDMQRQIQSWVEENNRDDAEIAGLKLTVDRLNVTIVGLNDQLKVTKDQYEKRIQTLEDENKRTIQELRSSQSNDVSDATTIMDLKKQLEDVKQKSQLVENMMKEKDSQIGKWKTEYESKSTLIITLQKQVEETNLTIVNLRQEVGDKTTALDQTTQYKKDTDEELVRLNLQVTKKDRRIKELEERIKVMEDRVKQANDNYEKSLIKVKESNEALMNLNVKYGDLSKLKDEMTKGIDILTTKVNNYEASAGSYNARILELQDIVQKRELEIKNMTDKDRMEDEELKSAKAALDIKMKEIEGWRMEDASDNSKIAELTKMLKDNEARILSLQQENKDANVTIVELRKELDVKRAKIATCKNHLAELKKQLDEAHSLSLKFNIKREEKTEEHERVHEKEQLMAQYQKVQVQMEEVMKSSASMKAACDEIRKQNDNLTRELAAARAELETIKKQNEVLKIDLTEEKKHTQSMVQEKESFSLQRSKEVEKERSYFKSAEESVSTYRDDINKMYNTIATSFNAAEKELI